MRRETFFSPAKLETSDTRLFQASIISICLAILSLLCVSPMFYAHKLVRYPYLKDRYFCLPQRFDVDVNLVKYYVLLSSIFHFFLTLAVVVALYTAIYWRLRSR